MESPAERVRDYLDTLARRFPSNDQEALHTLMADDVEHVLRRSDLEQLLTDRRLAAAEEIEGLAEDYRSAEVPSWHLLNAEAVADRLDSYAKALRADDGSTPTEPDPRNGRYDLVPGEDYDTNERD